MGQGKLLWGRDELLWGRRSCYGAEMSFYGAGEAAMGQPWVSKADVGQQWGRGLRSGRGHGGERGRGALWEWAWSVRTGGAFVGVGVVCAGGRGFVGVGGV